MSDRTEGLSRRDALRVAALLGFCGAFPYVAQAIGPGLPRRGDRETIYQPDYPLMDARTLLMTTCAGCTGACPVRANREVGILAKVDGNPYSPRQHGDPLPRDLEHAASLRGSSCARGQSRVQNVHDPYRLVRPLARDQERGAGSFRTVDGEAVVRELLDGADGRPGLRELRSAALGRDPSATPTVVVAVDPRHQDRRVAVSAFADAFAGARALLGHPAPALAAATGALLGAPGWLAAPRWDRARSLVSWGADAVSSGLDPVGASWYHGEAKARRQATVVSVDPRLSAAGGMADLWVPVRPGGDRALAHWVARVWVEQGRIPAHEVPESILLRPERQLEQVCGLGRHLVERLAELLLDAGPGLAVAVGGGVTDRPGGRETMVAILRLAALTGAFGPGGAMEPTPDPIAPLDGPAALAEALSGPTPPRAVILVGDAGVQDTVWEAPILAALADPARVPVVVAVVTAMNRVAWLADYVLPDVTEFERVGLVVRHDGTSITQQVLPPIPAAGGTTGPVGLGLEGTLEALAQGAGASLDVDGATWDAIERAADRVPLPLLTDAEAHLLGEARDGRGPPPDHATRAVDALLARGWAPALPGPTPPPLPRWTADDAAASEPPPPPAPVLVTWREGFGGQADSDAQSWGSRAVREDNPLHASPQLLETVAGPRSDQIRIGETAIGRVHASQGIRPDAVALAVGYGQVRGFDGGMRIDGVAIPAAPRRCAGVAVGPLLAEPTVTLQWAAPRPEPTLWELLTPGGHVQLPSVERKHEDV